MHVTFQDKLDGAQGPVVIAVAKDRLGAVRWRIAGADQAAAAAAAQRFHGNPGQLAELFVPADGTVHHVVLLGIGQGTGKDWETAGGALAAKLLTTTKQVTLDLEASALTADAAAVAAFAGAAVQRAWRYDIYRTTLAADQEAMLEKLVVVGAPVGIDAAWQVQDAINQGLALTRTLVSAPPNAVYPETFVDDVVGAVEGLGLEITVLGEAEMEALGMGSLLAVSSGSARAPRMLALRWNGGGTDDPVVALVGKGVTFDSGGISIKPSAGMEEMKWDMGGAGAVAGTMKALALRKARANVVGVCGLVENMPDGAAARPGDVVTSMNGQTIEIVNTDAEGRLVLADAITWTQRSFVPDVLIDVATLTGAMIISLGNERAGMFSNDDALADQLHRAGESSRDRLWRFPLDEAYDKLIDSPIADMKNSAVRGAGSITAAQFLKRFVDDGTRWAHLDVAGMVWADKPGSTFDKGATGYGVRLLDRFIADNFG